jgi:hypothetical protein
MNEALARDGLLSWPGDHGRHPAARRARRRRRGSLLAELAMATVLVTIAMTLTVRVLGWVALERRGAERREQAVVEVANLMERITAYPFEEVTPDLAGRLTLSEAARRSLPDPELAVDVSGVDHASAQGLAAKRIAIRLRWRGTTGEWVAPVRLTSWIQGRSGS